MALETGVALETNGLPDRLDLSGEEVRLAIEAGVPIVASTDAHSVGGLGNMPSGDRDRAAGLGHGRERRQLPPVGRAAAAGLRGNRFSRSPSAVYPPQP